MSEIRQEKKFEKLTSTVFDRGTLESEIQSNKEKVRERKRSQERMLEEQQRLMEREEHIRRVLREKAVEQRLRYLKIGYVVMKAYWKKQTKAKRQEIAYEAYVIRNTRKRLRNVFKAIKRYSSHQSQWLKQVRSRFNLVKKQERLADWRLYIQSNKFKEYC